MTTTGTAVLRQLVTGTAQDAAPVSGEFLLRDDRSVVAFDREGLAKYLKLRGHQFDSSDPIRQLAGGLANRNYLILLDGKPTVLRRPPDGTLPPGAHDMAREHRILSRLCNVLPFVPRGLHYCGDTSVIGVPFQLIEFRAGRVIRSADLRPVAGEHDAPARLSKLLVETLARIHSVDAAAVGLGEFGRPEGFLDRAIAGWANRGARVAGSAALVALIEDIRRWLEGHHFAPRQPTLLHCDFKLDNIILAREALTPVAVVDWDMGTRGDPLFDLASMLSYWAEPGDPDCLRLLDQMPTSLPGFWSREKAAQRYAELTGLPLDDLPALRVLVMLKLGVVFLQLHQQWSTGAVREAHYAQFAHTGEQLLVHTRDLAKGRAA